MARTIQNKRGLEKNLPTLKPGELAVTTDTKKVFIGNENGNIEVPNKSVTDTLTTHLTEIEQQLEDGTAGIDDAVVSADKVWSSQKVQLQIESIPKGEKGEKGDPGTANVAIDDNVTNTTQTWTSSKINSEIEHLANNSPIQVSKNFFDKSKVTNGKYIGTNGTISDAEVYSLSDYTEILPNKVYSFKYAPFAGVFFTKDKEFISSTMEKVVTTPINAKYVQFGMLTNNVDSQQLSLGDALPPYEPYYKKLEPNIVSRESLKNGAVSLEKLGSDVVSRFSSSSTLDTKALLKHLQNPHIKTKISLFGDSITHGVGATGFKSEGTLIEGTQPNGNKYRDLADSSSWANNLRKWLDQYFNKDTYIHVLADKDVRFLTTNVSEYNDIYISLNSNAAEDVFEFDFYGTAISIDFLKSSDSGIFDIFIDGNKSGSVDGYATTNTEDTHIISGLSESKHTIKIRTTGTKNTSSSGYSCKLYRFKVRKYVTLDNLGVSGYPSKNIFDVIKANLTDKDHFVFIMSGTNDREKESKQYTYSYISKMVEFIKSTSPQTVIMLMSANPAPTEYNLDVYKFHQADVDMIVSQVASENSILHISHFNEFWKQCEYREIPLERLVGDGLHPSDEGHNLIFKTILRETGLAIKKI